MSEFESLNLITRKPERTVDYYRSADEPLRRGRSLRYMSEQVESYEESRSPDLLASLRVVP